MRILILTLLTSCLFLAACGSSEFFGLVTDSGHIEPIPKSGIHRVVHGETLYSIAWRYGLDYQRLAKRNGLTSYKIYSGEIIYLRGYSPRAKRLAAQHSPLTGASENKEPTRPVTHWEWPANGPVIGTFSRLNKGINISGQLDDPVYAAAAGKVVYSSNGLRTYGNLIIIKHNSEFLTAYAHNNKNLVKEGDWVKPGQEIAEMGSSGTHRIMLHFEIRRSGVPVNPLSYLSSR